MSRVTFDGDTDDDRRLWHSYVYWARERALAAASTLPEGLAPTTKVVGGAIVDEQQNRVDNSVGAALQAVVFTALALEYRLKRVLRAMGVPVPPKETLALCLRRFWSRLANVPRLDGTGCCRPPDAWTTVQPLLDRLVGRRNDLAHANYEATLKFLAAQSDTPQAAISLYNALVDAIKLINLGTGYETRTADEVDAYFQPLKA